MLSNSAHILKLLLGAHREPTAVESSQQHSLVTPQRPLANTPMNDGFNTAPSSPIVEGGSFWEVDVSGVQAESQTNFVRTCIAGPSSPTISQGSEEPHWSADLHRTISLEQGTSVFPKSHIFPYNPR